MIHSDIGVFPWGTPIAGWLRMENPLKSHLEMDRNGWFTGTPILGNPNLGDILPTNHGIQPIEQHAYLQPTNKMILVFVQKGQIFDHRKSRRI